MPMPFGPYTQNQARTLVPPRAAFIPQMQAPTPPAGPVPFTGQWAGAEGHQGLLARPPETYAQGGPPPVDGALAGHQAVPDEFRGRGLRGNPAQEVGDPIGGPMGPPAPSTRMGPPHEVGDPKPSPEEVEKLQKEVKDLDDETTEKAGKKARGMFEKAGIKPADAYSRYVKALGADPSKYELSEEEKSLMLVRLGGRMMQYSDPNMTGLGGIGQAVAEYAGDKMSAKSEARNRQATSALAQHEGEVAAAKREQEAREQKLREQKIQAQIDLANERMKSAGRKLQMDEQGNLHLIDLASGMAQAVMGQGGEMLQGMMPGGASETMRRIQMLRSGDVSPDEMRLATGVRDRTSDLYSDARKEAMDLLEDARNLSYTTPSGKTYQGSFSSLPVEARKGLLDQTAEEIFQKYQKVHGGAFGGMGQPGAQGAGGAFGGPAAPAQDPALGGGVSRLDAKNIPEAVRQKLSTDSFKAVQTPQGVMLMKRAPDGSILAKPARGEQGGQGGAFDVYRSGAP